jgi:hypothetical protein
MRNRSFALSILAAGLGGAGLVLALTGPATAAGDEPVPVPCAQIPEAIRQAPAPKRIDLAVGAIARNCRPLPAAVLAALRTGHWEDGIEAELPDRSIMVVRATEAAYPEAETLAVQLIETGRWPTGEPLSIESGSQMIRALKGVLTTFRAHLLLDVFEQLKDPMVRQAVVQTLRSSKLDEALLPALEAAYEESGSLREAANTSVSEQPEKTPPALHARLIRKLPEGPLLNWALRLANRHPSSPVEAAKKARGLIN